MRNSLVYVLLVIGSVTGCATAPQPVAKTIVAETTAEHQPALAEPIVAPISQVRQVEAVPLPQTSNPLPAVPRKMMGADEFAETNDEKLLNVYVGMSRHSVEQIMDGHQTGKWINPYKHQVVVDADGKKNEILFYLTRTPRQGQRITESMLTPVIFVDDRVSAIGRYPLKKLRRTACQNRTPTQGSCF